MRKINTVGLVGRVFLPTIVLSTLYLVVGYFCKVIPHLLLFCLIGCVTMFPIELGIVLAASKTEYGRYSLESAFVGNKKVAFWKIFIIVMVLFGVAGLCSALIAPLESNLFLGIKQSLFEILPAGFDWTDMEYLKSFSRPVLILTCVVYFIFNVFIGPLTEEIYFRGYLTSHYEKQTIGTPILVVILFSLYHFWMPFSNIFRILTFLPASIAAYKTKNIYISMGFHCMCNLFSVITFCIAALS